MKKRMSRFLSLLLCMTMVFTLIPAQVFAYYVADAKTGIRRTADGNAVGTINGTDAQGNATTINYDEKTWTETYPYGAFAFEQSSLALQEGGSGVIKVYRLGGTAGRATAYLTYKPVLVQDENGRKIYDYAVSAKDIDILVEEPQPAAKYQPVGKAPDPQRGGLIVVSIRDEQGFVLSLSDEADSYRWQILSDGVWQDITDSDVRELPMDAEYLDESAYDYRCVYEKDGVSYCTDSYFGETYVAPAEEELEPMPEDIELNAAPVYTALDLRGEGEDPYAGWAFELIFADGEWVKEIHLDALTDGISEAQEAAALTIEDCYGGEVLDAASTLLMSIADIDEAGPSSLGFEVETVTVDKAEGTAEVMITRTGDASRPVSIEWTTKDGTAAAGTDYVSASGTLMFYTGLTSLPVTVELIDDGVETDETVDFTIELSKLLGDDNCTLTATVATVSLYNSGTGDQSNLASRLYDADAVDVSALLRTSSTSVGTGGAVVTGTAQEIEVPEPVYSELDFNSPSELMTQSAALSNNATIVFANPSNAWSSTADAAKSGCWSIDTKNSDSDPDKGYKWVSAPDGETGKLGSGDKVKITSGIALTSKGKARANFAPAGVGAANTKILTQMFSGYSADIEANFAHDTSYLKGSTYCYSYTHPCLIVGSTKVPAYIKRFGSGPLNSAWQIKGSDGWNNGDESKYSNPYTTKTSGTFTIGSTVDMILDMSYHYEHDESKYTEHEDDWLNDYSMIWLKSMNLTRRSFAANAFTLEITTPNDANNAPGGAATLSGYTSFVPSVSLAAGKGGVTGGNALYVGSMINIGIGTVPAGYRLDGVVIYQKSGNDWKAFDKFQTSVASDGKSITIDTLGKSSSLTDADLKASYKIRLVYARESTVTIDLTTSADKDGKIDHLFKTSYAAGEHGFASGEGVGANITCGYSTFDASLGDYNPASITSESVAKTNGSTLTITKKNLQWINFNLSPEDTLLINGTAYPGNTKIWLNEAELNGTMNVRYYHRDFKKGINAMKTAISWMGVYLDSNGNGKIDGTFNQATNEFTLDADKDTFCGYINAGDRINEADLAPAKGSDGKYHQFFILVSYTMTPRCLDVSGVQGAKATDKAAVLPAITTAVNASSGAYSALTGEQRAYRYVYSGKDANGNYTSDGHIMYGAEASRPSYVAIPLGGDKHPAELSGDAYTWTPNYNWGSKTGMIIPYSEPDPITIRESVAGPTEVTKGYTIRYDGDVMDGYTYTDAGAAQINGYLASLCGTSTFVLATQEQLGADGKQYGGNGSYTDYLATGTVKISDDCVTMSGVSTNPDAEYLKSVKDPQGSGGTDIDMDESGSEMSEFNVDMGLNLGSLELGVTEAVTILLDENKIGFAIGVPLGSVEKDYDNGGKMGGKGFKESNKENWTQFGEFFQKGNFGGDDSYKSAATNKQSVDRANAARQQQASQQGTPQAAPRPYDKGAFQSKSFEVSFNVQIAFMFEFNPLDNGYYFEGMTVSFSGELEFRIQARLTVCPLVYFYFQLEASIEITTGLGVTRDAVEVKTPKLDATSAGKEKDAKDLTYFTRPTDRVLVTAAEFNADVSKYPGYKQDKAENPAYYYNANAYDSFEAARAAYLEMGGYYINSNQYELLTESEKSNYTKSGDLWYNNKFTGLSTAENALNDAQCYEFETSYKAFNVTFSGKLSVQVYEKDGSGTWKLNTTDYHSGFLTSDGTEATQVVIKTQDGMKLGKTVKVVLRAMEYDDKTTNDLTSVTRVCEIESIRNDVYWKGIEISPSVCIEVGAGIGVEMLKVELYAKVGLEATFLLGIYNGSGYDAGKVESFGFSIGLGLRVVALVFTFELDAVTYTVDYEDGEWTRGFHFLNDWVDGYETSALGEDEFAGITIRMPKRTAQNLYAPEDNIEGELRTQAVSYPGIPFQLSSYGGSVDAAVLTSNMMSGSQYRIFSAGGRNFIIYTLSRTAAAEEDSTMLVLSELTYVPATESKGAIYGLANPVDSILPQKYITLDNDATGDLDFDVWVDSAESAGGTTYTVRTAWVSYAEDERPTNPTEPTETKPAEMTADNYNTLTAPEVTATEDVEEKQAQEAALAAFKAWKDYYAALASYDAWVQQRLANAAKNTVVKTADWSFTAATSAENTEPTYSSGTAFAVPAVIGGDNASEGTTNLVFAPVGSSGAVFYGSTETLDTTGDAYDAYCDYLSATYGANPGADTKKMVNGLKAIRKSSLDVYGTRSALNAKLGTNDVSTMVLAENQVLTDLQVTKLDSKYYLAYTTAQYEYEDCTLGGASTKDMVTVTRLYLRTFDPNGADDAAKWGTPLKLRETRDFERQSGKDGCYSNSGIVSAYDSAYISGLQFLAADIDAAKLTNGETLGTQAVSEDTFLLFEMNGATYIILSDSLESLTGTTSGGTVYPFFNTTTTVKDDGSVVISPSGKDNVTIGADASGTPYAVYTSAVENTTNNALYVSKYDAASGTWGEGIMLAMNNMNVYEAALAEGWDAETTQAAYLGLSGRGNGLLTDANVTNLFGDKATSINKTLGAVTDTKLLGDKTNFVFSGLQATAGADGKLLVVSEGIGSEMTVQSFPGGVYSVVPQRTDGSMDTVNGLYAVSYGGGAQALGNAAVSFNKADFSKGSELYVNITAENVGTSAFRYSAAGGSGEGGKAPLVATLKADSQELAKWTIEDNLLSGQSLYLEGYCTPLANDLPTGTQFVLTLSEDSTYFITGAASASATLFTLEAIPDLGVEGLSADVTNIGKDFTELSVSFTAANRGSGPAEGVYAQFSYRTGTDENGNGIYAKLDLSSSNLTVGQETALSTNAVDESTMTLANGILKLSGMDLDGTTVSQNLKAGYGRTVSGTITVPAACFDSTDGTLELKVELFSAKDNTGVGDGGIVTAVSRKEYYTANNLSTRAVPAETAFTVADAIVIPLGTTTLIPLTAVSALGEKPNPVMQEIDDSTEGDGFNIGILNFKMSSSDGGRADGVISITPTKTGSGIIEVNDVTTNTKKAIAFTVTGVGEGIDIYNDNSAFIFRNADGTAYSKNGSNQSWTFMDMATWGTGSNVETPLRSNLSVGQKDASFTFTTVAESIDLYYGGSVSVTSTFPGFGTKTYSGAAGKQPITVEFGANGKNTAYTVTIKVTSNTANFDRLVEHYSGGTTPIPSYDGESPAFYWSRSFPSTASIKKGGGTKIPLQLYVLDNEAVSYITVDGTRYDTAEAGASAVLEKIDGAGQLWCYDFGVIAENKNYAIAAYDASGNMTVTTLVVDWFADSVSGDASTVSVPDDTADFKVGSDPLPTVITANEVNDLNITFAGGAKAYETHYLASDFVPVSAGSAANVFPIGSNGNGIYLTYVYGNEAKTNWSAKMLVMDRVDQNIPQISVTFDRFEKRLNWSIYKEGSALIDNVTVNGYKVNSGSGTTLSGSVPILCSGDYTVTATVGSTGVSQTITVPELAVDISQCTFTAVDAWNAAQDNGSITADLNGICGGYYTTVPSDSTEPKTYTASYEIAIAAADAELFVPDGNGDPTSEWALTGWESVSGTKTFTGLVPGDYLILIRDKNNTADYLTISLAVVGDPITVSTAVKGTSGRNGEIAIIAHGGGAEAFEYAILPVDGKTPVATADEFKARETAENPIVWQTAAELNDFTITGLKSGDYVIAVRGVYAADEVAALRDAAAEVRAKQAALDTAKENEAVAKAALDEKTAEAAAAQRVLDQLTPGTDAYTEAEEDLAAANSELTSRRTAYDNAVTARETAETVLAEAQADCTNKQAALQTESAKDYADDSEYWNGVLIFTVNVPHVAPAESGGIRSVAANENDVLVYKVDDALTAKDSKAIVSANAGSDVLVINDNTAAFIPEGTLPERFDVNRLVATAAEDGSDDSKVIRYTDLDGNETIIPFGIVVGDRASYFVYGPGDYEIVESEAEFTDIAGLWGEEQIDFVARRCLFNGTGDGCFSPYVTMNRAMFVTVLWRMNGCPTEEASANFTDLEADWYASAVAWACANGIVQGYDENTFGPNDPVTREQMCTLVLRFLSYLGMKLNVVGDEIAFSDDDQISSWAKDAVALCSSTGLINGYEGLFAPQNSATRMEVSAVLTRFITALIDKYCR